MLYQADQTQADWMWPLRALAKASAPMLLASGGLGPATQAPGRKLAAAGKVLALAEVTHKRPPWLISSVLVKGEQVPVTEHAVLVTPFATLLRFAKPGNGAGHAGQPDADGRAD